MGLDVRQVLATYTPFRLTEDGASLVCSWKQSSAGAINTASIRSPCPLQNRVDLCIGRSASFLLKRCGSPDNFWQWVASTFASKPYLFNRENLERYTAGIYCRTCPHAAARTCPFERDYEALERTLFPRLNVPADPTTLPAPPRPFTPPAVAKHLPNIAGKPLLWIHTDSLNPDSPMLLAHPDSPAVFLWDTEWITKSSITLKRLLFLAECLQEMPGTNGASLG